MKPFRLSIIFLFAISSPGIAQQKATHRYYNKFNDPTLNSTWMNSHTIVLSNDSTKEYYSRTDSKNPYSAGIEVEIPQDLKRKNFRITVKCYINMTPGTNNQLVISISKNDSAIYWEGLQLGDSILKHEGWHLNVMSGINDSRKWYVLNVSTLIPGNLPADSKVKIFVWNADGKSETDLYEMDITFTETPLTSFLPK